MFLAVVLLGLLACQTLTSTVGFLLLGRSDVPTGMYTPLARAIETSVSLHTAWKGTVVVLDPGADLFTSVARLRSQVVPAALPTILACDAPTVPLSLTWTATAHVPPVVGVQVTFTGVSSGRFAWGG